MMLKAQATRTKQKKMECMKIKSFWAAKETLNKMEKKCGIAENILPTVYMNGDSIQNISGIMQLNSKSKQMTWLKMDRGIE